MAAPTKATLEKQLLEQKIRGAKAEADKAELTLGNIRASNDFNRTLILDGILLDTEGIRAQLLTWFRRDGKKPITIYLNTPGGSVFDGNALLGTIKHLQSLGVKFTVIGSGTVMSYGMILLQAADVRQIEKDCVCMLHGIAAPGVMGAQQVDQILDVAKMLKEVDDRLVNTLAARSNISKARIKKMMERKDVFLTAEKCLEYGFCDEVV